MKTVKPKTNKTASMGKKVVVVGGGGAGLCAAIAAIDAGAAEVTLLEKSHLLGGDTLISGNIISAAGTRLQKQAGIEDSPHQYLIDHIKGGRYKSDLILAATLVQNGAAAWDWLMDKGCQFPGPEGLHVQHDHTIARSVKLVPPGMVPVLKQAALDRGVRFLLETPARSLILEDGKVAGVRIEQDGQEVELRADSVVLACGGFGRNAHMVRETCPALAEAVSWNAPGNTGDGIQMAIAAGADIIDYPDMTLNAFRVIQSGADVKHKVLHPTYLLAGTRALGSILVGTDGKRFYDEMARSYEMVEAAMQRGPYYFNVFDARIAQPSPWLPEKTFEEQWQSAIQDGMVAAQADSLEALAEQIDVPAAALAETVARWNRDVDAGKDSEYGRSEGLGKIETASFYAYRLKPAIVQSLGGLRINPQTQVLTAERKPIPGLFAAGQITGGVHGADYIGGSSLLELVVFGVIAGNHAAGVPFSW